MPWQLPQEDVDKAWGLINRKSLRWELRDAGGVKLAIDEVRQGRSTSPMNLEICDTTALYMFREASGRPRGIWTPVDLKSSVGL